MERRYVRRKQKVVGKISSETLRKVIEETRFSKSRSLQSKVKITCSSMPLGILCGVYRIFMRILGPTLFVAAEILIQSVAVIFLFVFYPELYLKSPIFCLIHTMIGVYLMINITFNHFACAWTAPGSPAYCPDPGKLLGEKISIVDGRKIYQFSYHLTIAPNVNYRYCHMCKCIKPPRAHHCSVLGRCVLNMDHYCPWMANTVGFFNYRYFVLFLVYLFLACIYVICFFCFETVQLSPIDKSFIYLNLMFQTNLFYSNTLSASTYCFSLALAAIVSSSFLVVWHLYLCFTNQTTIEFYILFQNRSDSWSSCLTSLLTMQGVGSRNPFDEGWRKNLKRIFGDVPWYRNLWPSTHIPPPPKYPFELEDRKDYSDV